MAIARIKISFPLLAMVLRLPEGTKVLKVGQDWSDQMTDTFQILIEHPDLPETKEGELIPELVTPSWRVDETNRIEFNEWGIQK